MSTEHTVTAQTIGLEYIPSEIERQYRVKDSKVARDWFTDREYIMGQRVVAGGFGTYITATPSKLVLKIRVGDAEYEVWTERAFKRALDIRRLTKKVRSRIIEAMPKEVAVLEQESRRGKRYYTLSEEAVASWVGQICQN